MDPLNRRELLQTAPLVAAASLVGQAFAADPPLKGRIRHSLVHWCYKDHLGDFASFCRTAKALGCQSIELCPPDLWPTLKEHGLTCAISGSHGFVKGLNNPDHWAECQQILRERIDQSARFGCPSVITFTGMAGDIPPDVGARNCVTALKQLAGLAEEKHVTLCLEMLNTRAADHPMKGHPGYQGDHTEYCIDIL
jgi:hydroxypyruvate isomerase